MKNAYDIHKRAGEVVRSKQIDDGQKIARAIQYFAEDWEVVQKELAAGKEALEKLHEISGQALGKE